MSKHRSFTFTFYPTETRVFPGFDKLDCRYGIYQPEKCPKSGRLHYQGYIVYTNPRTLRSVAKALLNSHVEPARHDGKARNYCKKLASREGQYVEYGELPTGPGRKQTPPQVFENFKTEKVFRSIMEQLNNPLSISATIAQCSANANHPYILQCNKAIAVCHVIANYHDKVCKEAGLVENNFDELKSIEDDIKKLYAQ